MTRRLWHLLLSVTIALAPGPSGSAGFFVSGIAAVSAGMLVGSTPASAQTERRSGGYGLPSGGGGSYAAPAAAPVRRPSVSSGGYGGGDRAISRQSSGQSLQQYRAGQQPIPQPDRRPSAGQPDPWAGAGVRRPSAGGPGGFYAPNYGNGGWNAGGRGTPPYAPTQRFGVWDGLMLWGLLNSLNQPGRSQFFYSNQDDPGYRQWRTQMNAAAAQDPAVQQKLADLDARMAQLQGQPRAPGMLPPVVSTLDETPGDGPVFLVLVLGGGLFLLFWFWRRRGVRTTVAPGVPAALGGSAQTRFRVGMVFPVDPTPFVLACVHTKVTGIDGERASVEAVGVLMDGNIPLHRLYLPGRAGFFQLHLDRAGNPDECRYFSLLDEISPASQEEWGVWLDPAQGLIGWPQFQTKDGKTYDRVWAGGGTRIPPRDLTETIQDLSGTSNRMLHAMLYGTPTGAPPPAPQTEYVLVAAIEDRGQAWVEIHAGIDINPSALTLPAVSLA